MNNTRRLQDDQMVEARLAARLASGLTVQSQALPADISERLRFAREQALNRAREARQSTTAVVQASGATINGAGLLVGFSPWWHRVASMVPLAVLVAGFLAIDHWSVREQVVAAADFDTQLLADDLPPAAFSDPGFAEFLRSSPAP